MTPRLPESPRLFTWSLKITGMSGKLPNIFLWFLNDSWTNRRSKVTSLKFDKSWNVWQASNYFSMILNVFWITRRFKMTFLKFDKSWNVWQASKYFSMIFKRLLDYQKVEDDCLEVWQVLECLPSFKIFFYDFQKTPGVPGGPIQFFWSCRSFRMFVKLQNIFLWFLEDSWIAWRSYTIFLKL